MKHYLGICLILLTLAAIILFAFNRCVAAVDRTVMGVRDAFVQVLHVQPQITVDQRVILTQTTPIAEFAVVTKEELVGLDFNMHLEVLTFQVPLTEKKLTAQSAYRIKAGFDLTQPFTVSIDPVTQKVRAKLPHAQILSVEPIGELTYKGDDAWLNHITDSERQDIVNHLNHAARDAAEASALKSDAERQIAQRLNELIKHNGEAIQLEWTEATPTPVPTRQK